MGVLGYTCNNAWGGSGMGVLGYTCNPPTMHGFTITMLCDVFTTCECVGFMPCFLAYANAH